MTALDRPTCEAIIEKLLERRYSVQGAVAIVREMMQQPPEPPATPSEGALRAAVAIYSKPISPEPIGIYHEAAAIIDEQTGLPELVAVCKELICKDETCPSEKCRRVRAALAKYDGVSESASQENKP